MFRSLVSKSKNFIFKQKDEESKDLSGDDEDLIVIGKHKGVGNAKTQLQSIEDLAGKHIIQEEKYAHEYHKEQGSAKGDLDTILKALI